MSLFSRIVIVGVGMMGGSIGLAARNRNLADGIIGIDSNSEHLEIAQHRGAIDYATNRFEEGLCCLGYSAADSARISVERPRPELVIVATPVCTVADYVREIAETFQHCGEERNVLITDIGSTKATICGQTDGCRFIGSHPIAGSERIGPAYSDENLFKNRLTVISPSSSIREVDIGLLVRFWQKLGSNVVCLPPEEHDSRLARTSHLPHLLSALLAENLQNQDVPFTGSGFLSTTRLASGGPDIWRDIVSTNQEAILEAIRQFETGLTNLRDKIRSSDWDGVAALLESAKEKRDRLEPA